MDGWMNGWMDDGWMDRQGRMDVDEWMVGWKDGCVNGWIHQWINGWTDSTNSHTILKLVILNRYGYWCYW